MVAKFRTRWSSGVVSIKCGNFKFRKIGRCSLALNQLCPMTRRQDPRYQERSWIVHGGVELTGRRGLHGDSPRDWSISPPEQLGRNGIPFFVCIRLINGQNSDHYVKRVQGWLLFMLDVILSSCAVREIVLIAVGREMEMWQNTAHGYWRPASGPPFRNRSGLARGVRPPPAGVQLAHVSDLDAFIFFTSGRLLYSSFTLCNRSRCLFWAMVSFSCFLL